MIVYYKRQEKFWGSKKLINSLHIRNFKQYKDQSFHFSDKITVIIGPNGVGKSTILEAIEFVLFGKVKRKERYIKDIATLINRDEDRASVELYFTSPINNKSYAIKRTINRHGKTRTTASLRNEDGKIISAKVKEINSKMKSILGIDEKMFSSLYYVRQGEITQMTVATPKERTELILKSIGLNSYLKYANKANSKIRELRKTVNEEKDLLKKAKFAIDLLPDMELILKSKRIVNELLSNIKEGQIVYKIKELSRNLDEINRSIISAKNQFDLKSLQTKIEKLNKEIDEWKLLKSKLEYIPQIIKNNVMNDIQKYARLIFTNIFPEKYADFIMNEKYDIYLVDNEGHSILLDELSGGEDVCANFALRVGVVYAIQQRVNRMPKPPILILDEPGVGLDSIRRALLPKAIDTLQGQVIIVTHMNEIMNSADMLIRLEPQGRDQPKVDYDYMRTEPENLAELEYTVRKN